MCSSFFATHTSVLFTSVWGGKNNLHVVCMDSNGETQNSEFATNNQKLMKREVGNVNI